VELTLVQEVVVNALPIIFAITVHEAAHGYAAKHFGDLTAAKEGRITLNPLKHIDPYGTILLPLLTLMIGGILLGKTSSR
jgi:Zn-dependent protease